MAHQEPVKMDATDLPDGFQMTELGPLPAEWRVVRLAEVADFSRKLVLRCYMILGYDLPNRRRASREVKRQ